MRCVAAILAAVVASAAGCGGSDARIDDQGHAPSAKAYDEGIDWLAQRLGIGGRIVKGADAGP
jgi:hypothetical protein